MIEGGILPALWRMAACAILPILPLVSIVFGVAAKAILPGGLQITHRLSPCVAACASCCRVLSRKLKRQQVVIEFAPIAIHPIVTGQALCSKSLCVYLGVSRIDLGVAIGATCDDKL